MLVINKLLLLYFLNTRGDYQWDFMVNLFIKLLISYQVAKKQGVATDMTTLLALSEKADNDIRSCLNTLQVRLN